MKKITKLISLLLLLCHVIIFIFSAVSCSKSDIKNLIYIIGDGMGYNHIENTKIHAGIDKFAFEDFYVGDVTTHSASSDVTDSAAAATALATGVKTDNDVVGQDGFENDLENIMELSKKLGKRTAIVTTDVLSGATPAGFSAHVSSRYDAYGIATDQADGAVDLLIGKYSSGYRVYQDEFTGKDFSYVETLDELKALPKDGRIVANLENVDSAYDPAITDAVSLKSLVEYALDYLTVNNRKGFTLMVEGGYIDKHSHNNDIMLMMYAMLDLNDAIDYILEWAKGRTDTAIILTADHETGGLKLASDKSAISGELYTTSGHTGAKVPLYLCNVTTDMTSLDNTDVYTIAKKTIKG